MYLTVEDALRPLYVRVLDAPTPRRSTVGVRTRLVSAWVVGSATYLVSIYLVLSSLPIGKGNVFVYGTCLVGLVVGVGVTVTSARSVAKPLDGVAEALARVERGDLEVSVPVDDAGEIGRLQAGFNRMVTGLRERDKLERLFARHVGPDVAKRAVATTELGGVMVEATVMFVDIIGSTALATERPPDAVVAMINALFGHVIDAVSVEGGLVNQFQGDGALCIFGAPIETRITRPGRCERRSRSAATSSRSATSIRGSARRSACRPDVSSPATSAPSSVRSTP